MTTEQEAAIRERLGRMEAQRRQWREHSPEVTVEVEAVDVTATKAGILAALNEYGAHADNG